MALKVLPTPQRTLKVTHNVGGMQGSGQTYNPQQTVNPQQTAPATTVQQTYNPQAVRTAALQAVALSNAKMAAAVEAARRAAAEAAAAAAKAARRQAAQLSVDTKTDTYRGKLTVQAGTAEKWKGRAAAVRQPVIKQPERSQYDLDYDQAYQRVMRELSAMQAGKNGGIGGFLDKVTFGADRRQMGARSFAGDQLGDYINGRVDTYSKTFEAFEADRAARIAKIEASKFSTLEEFELSVRNYEAWEAKSIRLLEKQRAEISGEAAAYEFAAGQPISTRPAQALGFVKGQIVGSATGKVLGKAWQYTLGSGSENIPSVVTAPSRVINWIGNLNTQDRNIYKYGGETANRIQDRKNAWQATFNQRNFNIRPVVDQPYNKDQAWSELESGNVAGSLQQLQLARRFKAATDSNLKEQIAQEYWKEKQRGLRNQNSIQEFVADPLTLLSGTVKAAGKAGYLTKAANALRETRAGVWTTKAVEAFKETKAGRAVAWLGSEHQTYDKRVSSFIDEEIDDIYQKKPQVRELIEKWIANKPQIKAAEKSRLMRTVVEDFGRYKNKEVKLFEEYFVSRDWSAVNGAEKLSKKTKNALTELAAKYRDTFDEVIGKERAAGIATPYRKNYLPQYKGRWSVSVKEKPPKQNMGDWWFTKPRQTTDVQGRKRLIDSISARLYHSQAARHDLPVLRDIVAGSEDLGRNIDRIEAARDIVKKTRWEKMTNVIRKPTQLWKKAVLLGNPAWYVNNEAYNLTSGFAEGGFKFLKNQVGTKRYFEKVAGELTDEMLHSAGKGFRPSLARARVGEIASGMSQEVGRSRLARLATKQENRSRIALYRTFRERGLTHEQAIKKLDRAMFSYTTKNWERPVKAVVPFWHFKKSLVTRAATLSVDSPVAAAGFNRLDKYQSRQYDKEFDTIAPELQSLGFSQQEIDQIREDNRKYFSGRLKVGNKWITTPFNALSAGQFKELGINPFLAALMETASAKDNFGAPLSGREAELTQRLISKFPQLAITQKAAKSYMVASGNERPRQSWIAAAGSEGIGYSKERQGYDKSKANYDRKLDPRAKLVQDSLALLGVPRALDFDKKSIVESKRLQKVAQEYFKQDWSGMEYEAEQTKKKELFSRYGITEDEFYGGILSKFDSDTTKRIKGLKSDAAIANKKLFEEYQQQPMGTRNMWATQKLRELVAAGYFDKNPYLKSFKWITPETVARADKQAVYKSGNWPYQYDGKFFKSAESMAKYKAHKERKQFVFEGKHFKSQASMDKFIKYNSDYSKFWRGYYAASTTDRRRMLAENPQYNTRADWTKEQWAVYNDERKKRQRSKIQDRSGDTIRKFLAFNTAKADGFARKRDSGRRRLSVKYALKA